MPDETVASDCGWRDAHAFSSTDWNLPVFLALLAEIKAKSVLDVGCGNGAQTALLAEHGYTVTGCDIDENGLTIARANFPKIKFFRCSISDDPPVWGVDVVLAAEVIEHLFLPRTLFTFARKALKPGGHMILSTPFHGYWKNLAICLANKWDDHHTVYNDGGHIKFFSPDTLENMAREMGFHAIRRRFAGRFWGVWKCMVYLFGPH